MQAERKSSTETKQQNFPKETDLYSDGSCLASRRLTNRIALGGLFLALFVALVVPSYLALKVYPIGEGPDESSHYDHAAFKFSHGLKTIEAEKGFYLPGKAPLGQAHQPPLYYWFGAGVYSLFIDRTDLGPFLEYQLGVSYHSDGYFTGGKSRCTWVHDTSRIEKVPELPKIQRAFYALRLSSAVFFTLCVLATFLAARLLFPEHPLAALAAALLYLGIPGSVWRSGYVNNDNLLMVFCSVSVLLGIFYLHRVKSPHLLLAAAMGLVAAAAFLTKYNGVWALGVGGLAILLRGGQPLTKKIIHAGLMVLVFSLCVAPDLIENYRVDGDLLSEKLIIETVPFLYRPSSYLEVIGNGAYWHELLGRVWINFHNFGQLDLSFPRHFIEYWLVFLGVSAGAALLFFVLPERWRLIERRMMLFLLLSCAGAVAVWLHLAKNFPLPDGRYIHVALLPFSVAVVVAFAGLFRVFGRFADGLVLLGTLLFAAFGYTLMLNYLPGLYKNCHAGGEHQVAGGADFEVMDLHGDGQDELLVYYRSSHTGFVLERGADGFQVEPTYTRRIGFNSLWLDAGDINGDGKGNPVFWNPVNGILGTVDGRDIAGHNLLYNPKSYGAGFPRFVHFPQFIGRTLTVADLNGDGVDDFSFFSKGAGPLTLVLNKKVHGRYGGHLGRQDLEISSGSERGVLQLDGLEKLAWQRSQDELEVLQLAAESYDSLQLAPFDVWAGVDFDGDGTDEIILGRDGESCLEVWKQISAGNGARWQAIEQQICLGRYGYAVRKDALLRAVRQKEGIEQLAIFDRRLGLVYLVSSDSSNWAVSTYNPGWMAEKTLLQIQERVRGNKGGTEIWQ